MQVVNHVSCDPIVLLCGLELENTILILCYQDLNGVGAKAGKEFANSKALSKLQGRKS